MGLKRKNISIALLLALGVSSFTTIAGLSVCNGQQAKLVSPRMFGAGVGLGSLRPLASTPKVLPIPLYSKNVVLSTSALNTQPKRENVMSTVITKDNFQTVSDFYKDYLSQNGWSINRALKGAGPSMLMSVRKDRKHAALHIVAKDKSTL